jgi:hypothetical protein
MSLLQNKVGGQTFDRLLFGKRKNPSLGKPVQMATSFQVAATITTVLD